MKRFTPVLHAVLVTTVLFGLQGVSLAQEKNREAMVQQQEIGLIEIGMAQEVLLETPPGHRYELKDGIHAYIDYEKNAHQYKLVGGLSTGTDYLYELDQYGALFKTFKVIVK